MIFILKTNFLRKMNVHTISIAPSKTVIIYQSFEYTFLSKRQPAQKELFFSIRLQFLSTFIERNENHWSTTCALRVNFKPKVRMYQCLFYVWYDMIWYELLGLSPSLLGCRNSLEYQRISRVRAPKASMEYPWVQTTLIKSDEICYKYPNHQI